MKQKAHKISLNLGGSLPMRERELKQNFGAACRADVMSLPMRERELKRPKILDAGVERWSLPMRERELKRPRSVEDPFHPESLPMRERELKLTGHALRTREIRRSPCGSAN